MTSAEKVNKKISDMCRGCRELKIVAIVRSKASANLVALRIIRFFPGVLYKHGSSLVHTTRGCQN